MKCVVAGSELLVGCRRWGASESPLCELDARVEGTIEDAGSGGLHLDFANKNVGGGVLRNGCVQDRGYQPERGLLDGID